MARFRAPSPATRATLALLAEHAHGLHGYDITRHAGVPAGTLYPMLARLEGQGLLTAHWQPAPEVGRPPRHVYRLTATGMALARRLQEEVGSSTVPPVRTLGLRP